MDTIGPYELLGKVANRINGGADTWLNSVEADGYIKSRDWTVQWQVAFGQQNDAAVTRDPLTGALRDSRWWGASAQVAYRYTRQLEGTLSKLDKKAPATRGKSATTAPAARKAAPSAPSRSRTTQRATSRSASRAGKAS